MNQESPPFSEAEGGECQQTIDDLLRAKANQTLTINFSSKSPFTMIGIYTATGEEICVETCGNRWSGVLPSNRDYKIRVALVRAEAMRNGRTYFTLNVSIK